MVLIQQLIFLVAERKRLSAFFASLLLLITVGNSMANAYVGLYEVDANSCLNTTKNTTHSTIQAAIDAADPDDVIQCESGIYTENIHINKPVSLIGVGSDCTDSVANTIIQKAANVPIVTLAASGTAVNPILLQDLCIQSDSVFGIDVPNSSGIVSYVTLNNVTVRGTNETNGTENERGLMVGTTASLTDFVVTDSAFDRHTYGWYFQKEVSTETSTVTRVTVTNTSFSNNDAKGIYVEKLSDAAFTGGAVHNNGIHTGFWNAAWNGGFDLNLKAGAYQNLTFDGVSFTDNGLNTQHGVALMIKARDDGGYAGFPAFLDNVIIQNSTISGNERGIRFGEVGKVNAEPTNIIVTNNIISTNNPIYSGGSVPGAVILISGGTVTVTGNTMAGNAQVFSQSIVTSTLTAYANNITSFTNAGLTSAVGTVNGRHNWWDTYATQPTGVDNDSWAFRLGASMVSWADGTGSVNLADSNEGMSSLSKFGGGGLNETAVLINHGRPDNPADAPFGKAIAADIGSSQCSDFYDAFVIKGSGNYDLGISLDSACTAVSSSLYQFALAGNGAPDDDNCSPDTACWLEIRGTAGVNYRAVTVPSSNLLGTPYVAPSMNNNDPTAVSFHKSTATVSQTNWIFIALLFILAPITGLVYWRKK